MNGMRPNDLSIETLQVNDLVSWVERRGWERIAHPNKKFFVFVEPRADKEPPLMVAIPRSTEYGDAYQRLAEAVNLLATFYEKSSHAIIQEVARLRSQEAARLRRAMIRQQLRVIKQHYSAKTSRKVSKPNPPLNDTDLKREQAPPANSKRHRPRDLKS